MNMSKMSITIYLYVGKYKKTIALFAVFGYNKTMLNLIVAPKVQNPNAEKFTKKIVKFLKEINVEFSVYFSRTLEDVSTSINELTSFGETEFVLIGDDVTLHQFVNSFKDLNKIKLGIIPTSAKDDFARYLELETSPILAIKRILKRNIEEIDYLIVNDKCVVNNVVLGAGVEIEEDYSQFKWKNFITKTITKFRTKNKIKSGEYLISTKNNKPKTENVYELIIANGGYSKGKKVSPLSNVKDGLFNLICVTQNLDSAEAEDVKDFNKNRPISEEVKQSWLSNLKITNEDNKIKAMLDGKIYNFDKLDIVIVEKGLKIYK